MVNLLARAAGVGILVPLLVALPPLPSTRWRGGATPGEAQGGEAPPAFTDITADTGLDFSHFNGSSGHLLLPEIIGAGGALFDYDNDGDLDLFLVQGAPLGAPPHPEAQPWPEGMPRGDRLYRNDLAAPGGGVRFRDVTGSAGLQSTGFGMGAATGDVDNDGWIDLYVTNLGRNELWRNNGDGTFRETAMTAGVADPGWSTSAAFVDIDRDGWLDLFVANYVAFSVEGTPPCFSQASAPDYCGPDAYAPTPDRFYRNRGDGTFEDRTAASGIAGAFGAGLGVAAADVDNDGWADLLVANDGDANQLWTNNGDGAFTDDALLAGVAFNHRGQAEAGMGVAIADYDDDGDEDLFLSHLEGESNTLYVNTGGGLFEDRTIAAGLHGPSLPLTGFGTGFRDYDNDGRLDLVMLNGAVGLRDRRSSASVMHPLRQANLLFHQSDDGRYQPVLLAGVPPEVSRGAAFGDLDNDGDVDIVEFVNHGRARVLDNTAGTGGHWIGLRVVDRNRDALQTRVEIVGATGTVRWRRVHTDGSYCAASDPRVLVGLGAQAGPVQVRVHWGADEVDEVTLDADRYWELRRGAGPVPLYPTR